MTLHELVTKTHIYNFYVFSNKSTQSEESMNYVLVCWRERVLTVVPCGAGSLLLICIVRGTLTYFLEFRFVRDQRGGTEL